MSKEKSLLEEYTPLVVKIAGGFRKKLPKHIEHEDLVAAGMSGLWDVIRKYPEGGGEGFENYIRIRVRGAILDELRTQDWLPRRTRATAAARNLPVFAILRYEDMGESEQELALGRAESAEDMVDDVREARRLRHLISFLPPREHMIAVEHYFNDKPFIDLAREMGVSGARLSQINARIVARLKLLEKLVPHEPGDAAEHPPKSTRRRRRRVPRK